jgi:hypothetical protein
VYNIYPYGIAIPLYCDMDSDDGGWTLVFKAATAIDNTPLRNDAGYNYAALQNLDFSSIGVLSRPIMANLGSEFRTVSSDGSKRIYWQGPAPYSSSRHVNPQFLNNKMAYNETYRTGCIGTPGGQESMVVQNCGPTDTRHMVLQRFCCGNGVWWNGAHPTQTWAPGSYTDGTCWIR